VVPEAPGPHGARRRVIVVASDLPLASAATVRPGARLRCLLFSDLLLDRPYVWADPAVADSRREAARQTLVDILAEARRRSVDLIACAGDLFSRHTVKPANMQWLATAFRSAGVPVLIAPGHEDFIGPVGGYGRYEWPGNVRIFDGSRLTPVQVADGITIWGAAHTEAHRTASFLDRVEVDRPGVNLALFHGAEAGGRDREPHLDECASFTESDIERAGFDHALVGHYSQAHFGRLHTYPGAPIAHDFGSGSAGGAVIITLTSDGSIVREFAPVSSPELHELEVDLTGAQSRQDALRRIHAQVGDRSGILRISLRGRLSPDIVLLHADFVQSARRSDQVVVVWNVEADLDVDQIADEQTIRGQFVRDVLSTRKLPEERRQRVLLAGLRALGGHEELDGPR
jgi:DNA repair protein SbcD/Mre11